jgi:hypothetical protein
MVDAKSTRTVTTVRVDHDVGSGSEDPAQSLGRSPAPCKWKPKTLAKLFGKSTKESLRTRISRRAREQEENYLQVMAELEEDDSLDDGQTEISDSEEFQP